MEPLDSDRPFPPPETDDAVSKRDQILALFLSGIEGVEDLALLTQSRPKACRKTTSTSTRPQRTR